MKSKIIFLFFTAAFVLLFAGCSSSSQINPVVCGITPYKWLNGADMGKIQGWQTNDTATLDKETLTRYLEVAHIAGLTPQYGTKMYRYSYETQDRGQRILATAMFGIPDYSGTEPITLPVALWLHGTCGWSDKCSASNDIVWQLMAAALVSQGFIVVAPDYIGMDGMKPGSDIKAPYMVGEATAIASLDAMRALNIMIKRSEQNVIADPRTFIWGASQGGHATLFTELYAPYYYPELNIAGALALIPPASLVKWTEQVVEHYEEGTAYAGVIAVSFSRWYGYENRIGEVLSSGLPNNFATLIPLLMDNPPPCTIKLADYNVTNSNQFFTQDFVTRVTDGTWTSMDPWYCMYAQNSIGLTSVKRKSSTPIFYVVAQSDELIPPIVSRSVFESMCASDYPQMQYLECEGASHVNGVMWSLPEQFEWVNDRLAGKPLTNPCVKSNAVVCKGTGGGPM